MTPAMTDIRELVEHAHVVDVHEHHIPEIFLARDVGLLQLLRQSYAGWTVARPYPLPSESRAADPMLADVGAVTWAEIAPYVERSGSNAFVRNLLRALGELYEPAAAGITPDTWEEIDEEIRLRHADPRWPREVIRRAHVAHVVTDNYTDPLLDVRQAFGDSYSSVCRINCLALGWHPSSRDHNDNSAWQLAERLGHRLERFEDYESLLEQIVRTLGARGQVALKNALAYDRDIRFGPPDERLARDAWRKAEPTPDERTAFGDFVVDRLCALAGEHDVPVQMHLGTALIRGSHPMGVADLVERHPRTRFLLMHLAYPWSRDLLGLAFVYRNIWLDLTWSFLLSPSHFRAALHEAIEVLPDETRMMVGGDNWHAEETYGALGAARRLIGEVLREKLASGYFGREDAERLARRILAENAREFLGVDRDG